MNEEIKTLYIEAELHHKLKMRATETKKTIRELVEAALRLYLDRKDQEGG